ncbi:MAG: segregation/condensation protein A [Deltaproteobacteria bacterium]|nr:MAG: segregation/condensation protein A [Deltaproteobacteria bacterium]
MTDAGYSVELEVFEGPLDLLLHLVRKHELDILDIPIAFITEKYLEYLERMEQLNLDVAGEYLLMAATLAHIKSRELLPRDDSADAEDGEEEGEDPRQELIRRLLEYQKYKEAAEHLGGRPVVGRNVWPRGTDRKTAVAEDVDPHAVAPLMPIPVTRLLAALDKVLRRAKVNLAHTVSVDRLSVSDRINQLVDRFEREAEFSFQSCFAFVEAGTHSPAQLKHEVVVTFLAILEMARLGMVAISQPTGEEDIVLRRAADDLRARAERVHIEEERHESNATEAQGEG